MKKCKTFYETQTVSCLKEIVQPPQYPTYPPSDKILLRLWNKNILAEIYRNIQTLAFKVLQECSSLASRNDAVFSDTKHKHVCWKIFKVGKVFECVAGAYYFQCQVS